MTWVLPYQPARPQAPNRLRTLTVAAGAAQLLFNASLFLELQVLGRLSERGMLGMSTDGGRRLTWLTTACMGECLAAILLSLLLLSAGLVWSSDEAMAKRLYWSYVAAKLPNALLAAVLWAQLLPGLTAMTDTVAVLTGWGMLIAGGLCPAALALMLLKRGITSGGRRSAPCPGRKERAAP